MIHSPKASCRSFVMRITWKVSQQAKAACPRCFVRNHAVLSYMLFAVFIHERHMCVPYPLGGVKLDGRFFHMIASLFSIATPASRSSPHTQQASIETVLASVVHDSWYSLHAVSALDVDLPHLASICTASDVGEQLQGSAGKHSRLDE